MIHPFKISASILSADFVNLERDIKKLEVAGVDYLHIDVMDGVFVPNITIGAPVVKSIRGCTKLPLDVHLMITDPIAKIEDFAIAGSDIITIHYESCVHIDRVLCKIKSFGKKVGISIVPSTNVSCLEYISHIVDYILIMTVNPGFSGQEFIAPQLKKIKEVKNLVGDSVMISVDGGVNLDNIASIVAAGADVIVSGSSLFAENDLTIGVKKFRDAV